MVIGVLTARLAIYASTSLKDKRRVIKSIKDQVRHKFNVSIAETEALDARKQAVLTTAIVTTDSQYAMRSLQAVLKCITGHRGSNLLDYDIETL